MTEDDDIVAGPQKMSLKCPVRNCLHRNNKHFHANENLAEFYACDHTLSLFKMRTPAVL